MLCFHFFVLQLWFVLFNSPIAHVVANDCSINLSSDIPKFEPVMLIRAAATDPYALFKPTGQVTPLPLDTQLLLVCTGNNNTFVSLTQNSLELYCRAGGTFEDSAGTPYILSQLGCKSIPTSTLQRTTETCAQGQGFIFRAGFEYAVGVFASTFSICYDNVAENTFYTQNTLNGAAIEFSIQESTRRAFHADGMKYTTTATNNFYTTRNQKTRLQAYFGTNQPYVTATQFLARGHLTPDADFIFSYEQLSTYFYTNCAPEWQVINAGNWIRVENIARNLAASYGDDLHVYNGYMGILQLPNPTDNTLVSIYLDANNEIEAPKYYFKVLKHAPTNAAIVLVTLNNPFASATESSTSAFCNNVCVTAGVWTSYFEDTTRGYTFCCTLSEFKMHYADLPGGLTATTLLIDPNNALTITTELPTTTTPTPAGGCSIVMPTDIPNPEPVYVVSTPAQPAPQPLWPTGAITTLPVDTTLTLHCAGSGNQLNGINLQTIALTCQSDGTFYSATKALTFALSDLACTRIPTATLLTTSTPCADGAGYVFEAGFQLDTDFIRVFTICYDNSTEHTLYTRNIINGATQNFKINESTRRAFRADGMRFTTTATNNFYTNSNQMTRFESLFGVEQTYISSSKFLARGHLTPDADFIFGYEQLATYFYTNCAPEWQVVNAGNWIRVENLARDLASSYGTDLLTFTSTLGFLQLPNAANEFKPIYLDNEELIEAPLWYYKVMIHPQLPVDLVMITLNNPYAKASDVVEFCTNICNTYGVNSAYFTDLTRGYTFCCTLEDFQSAVTNLPTFDLPIGWTFKV